MAGFKGKVMEINSSVCFPFFLNKSLAFPWLVKFSSKSLDLGVDELNLFR